MEQPLPTSDEVPTGFYITEAASQHIQRSIKKRGAGIGIRIAIKTRGCSGKAYMLEFVDDYLPTDYIFAVTDNLAVYIDPKSFEFLRGTTLDYVKQGLNEGFEFNNPNEKGRCGCGESFNS